MAVAPQVPREEYLGSDSTDTYTYHFEVSKPEELHVYIENEEKEVQRLTNGTDFLVLGIDESGDDFDPLVGDVDGGPTGIGDIEGGKIKLLAGALPDGFKLIILRVLEIEQPIPLRENRAYFAKTHEQALDRAAKIDQQQQEQIDRSIKLSPTAETSFNTTLPPLSPDHLIVVNEDGDGFDAVHKAAFKGDPGDPGSGIPEGGEEYSILEKLSEDEGDAGWTEPISFSGISALTGAFFESFGIIDTLKKIIRIMYQRPQVNLTGTSNTVRERGDVVSGIQLTAAIVRRSNNIDQVSFYENPSTLLETQVAGGGIPAGGNSVHNYSGSFDDTTTFRVEVTDIEGPDGGPETQTATVTYPFVLPTYYGVGLPGLTPPEVQDLPKSLRKTSDWPFTNTFAVGSGEVFYIAIPESYSGFTKIIDVNTGFDVKDDWDLSTQSITSSFGIAANYKIYEFKNPQSAGNVQFRFER